MNKGMTLLSDGGKKKGRNGQSLPPAVGVQRRKTGFFKGKKKRESFYQAMGGKKGK